MNNTSSNVVGWLARIIGLLFAVFMSIFALDAKGVTAYLIHIIPSLIVIVAVVAGWVWPGMGAALFLILGGAATAFFHTYQRVETLLFITGPFVVLAVLFFVQWRLAKRATPPAGAPA